MSQQDFDEVVKQYNIAMSDFFKGDPEPLNRLFSVDDQISLAQLSGPFVIGIRQVTGTVTYNAAKYQEGATTFETLAKFVASELE
jgi:hypothetical protein